jgi:hypothetical protein
MEVDVIVNPVTPELRLGQDLLVRLPAEEVLKFNRN